MSPHWVLHTARLVLTPVGGADLADLRAIKSDPRVFAIMLGLYTSRRVRVTDRMRKVVVVATLAVMAVITIVLLWALKRFGWL